jgi:hypothetical protein
MKNLNPYAENSFDFFEIVLKKKRNKELKDRIELIKPDVRNKFIDYDHHFQNNILESLIQHNQYTEEQKLDFEELYDYRSSTFKKLLLLLSTTGKQRKMKCPYCGIGEVSTFDHYLPQGIFSAFTVHPKNLFCCCGKCNPKRGNHWLTGTGTRTTINLYTDVLPAIQYLFVDLVIAKDEIKTKFYLKNTGQINPNLFTLIKNHYDRLDLCTRFSENIIDVVVPFITTIRNNLKLADFNQIKANTLDALSEEQDAFGTNNWGTILKIALINHPDFNILL